MKNMKVKEMYYKLSEIRRNYYLDNTIDYTCMKKQSIELLEKFKEKACKEQRHNCQVKMSAKYSIQDKENRWYISCEDILNAPEPD